MAIVLWDLDGVHALWDDGVDEIARTHFSDYPAFPFKDKRTRFDFYNDHDEEMQDVIMQVMNFPDLYRMLKVDPKVQAAFAAVEAAGHTNRFVSTPWTNNKTCMQDKSDWIAEIYGEEVRHHLTLTYDKTMIRGDVLIDDKPELHGLFEDDLDFLHIIPTQPYNQHVPTPYRIDDWEMELPTLLAWLDIIDKINATKKNRKHLYA